MQLGQIHTADLNQLDWWDHLLVLIIRQAVVDMRAGPSGAYYQSARFFLKQIGMADERPMSNEHRLVPAADSTALSGFS